MLLYKQADDREARPNETSYSSPSHLDLLHVFKFKKTQLSLTNPRMRKHAKIAQIRRADNVVADIIPVSYTHLTLPTILRV